MCGITGIVAQHNICEKLFEGMQNLEYRGYDSAGMAVLCDGRLEVRKDAGKLALAHFTISFPTRSYSSHAAAARGSRASDTGTPASAAFWKATRRVM